jgi:tellurite resistance protein
VGLTILYIAKWSVARDDASAEVADPVQCCFVGLIGVATMLVAGGIQPYSPALAVILFTAGAAFAFGFAVWRTGGLWQGEREHAATTQSSICRPSPAVSSPPSPPRRSAMPIGVR